MQLVLSEGKQTPGAKYRKHAKRIHANSVKQEESTNWYLTWENNNNNNNNNNYFIKAKKKNRNCNFDPPTNSLRANLDGRILICYKIVVPGAKCWKTWSW